MTPATAWQAGACTHLVFSCTLSLRLLFERLTTLRVRHAQDYDFHLEDLQWFRYTYTIPNERLEARFVYFGPISLFQDVMGVRGGQDHLFQKAS